MGEKHLHRIRHWGGRGGHDAEHPEKERPRDTQRGVQLQMQSPAEGGDRRRLGVRELGDKRRDLRYAGGGAKRPDGGRRRQDNREAEYEAKRDHGRAIADRGDKHREEGGLHSAVQS